MKRDFGALSGRKFDLLVIGGGIYGAWVALDASLRGLSVALVEARDWAAGTSSASSKLIHGGLRYLEHGWLDLVRSALHERRRLVRLGPHRVWPRSFLLPLYDDSRVGRLKLGLGLWLYDRMAGRDQPVDPHRYLSATELRRRCPALNAEGLRGGFVYGDCQTDDARFVVELIDGALTHGAVAVNRAEALRLRWVDGAVDGAEVVDRESGKPIEIRAGVTVNCAGPWAGTLAQRADGRVATRLSRGVHLVLPPLPQCSDGLLVLSRSHGGIVFLLPWYGVTLLGTTDTDYDGDPAAASLKPADIDYLLAQANATLGLNLGRDDMLGGFAGLRTLPRRRKAASASVTRKVRIRQPAPRLIVPVGGKYTSARADADLIVQRAMRQLAMEPRNCATAESPLPWRPDGDYERWSEETRQRGAELGLDAELLPVLQSRHGARTEELFARIAQQPELGRRIVEAHPFCWAEVEQAARAEMARSLVDIFRRRIPLLLMSRLDEGTLERAAEMAGSILGWSNERKAQEVAAVHG